MNIFLNIELVRAAANAYKKMKAKDPAIKPQDGLTRTLEENEHLYPYGLTYEEHTRYMAAVTATCADAENEAKYEHLPRAVLDQAHGEYQLCADKWQPVSAVDAEKLVRAEQAVRKQLNKPDDGLDWEAAKAIMASGRVVPTIVGFLREKINYPICPLCGGHIIGFPALSRIDNATSICSACGDRETVADFTGIIDG